MTKLKILATFIFLAGLTIFLSFVFSGRLILPQSFSVGPITIHFYGIIMALAASAGFYLAVKRSSAYGVSAKQAEDILFWVIVGGFIGARLYHVLSSAGYYAQNPIDILKVYNGGLSIYGAVLGGIITLWVYTRLVTCHLSLVTLLDWLAPSVVLGQIIGRFGNLFNYEAFGYATNLPWKMFVPEQFRPEQFWNYSFFHPWFLYEALGNVIILFLLLKIGKTKRPGVLVFSYLLLYNLLRFALEFLRIDSTFIFGLRLNSIVSLTLVVLATLALVFIDKNDKIEQN